MIICINSEFGACDFALDMNNPNSVCYDGKMSNIYDKDYSVLECYLHKTIHTDKQVYNHLIEYIFSRTYIVENYHSFALFNTHCDFVNDEYFKRPLNKYWFLKNSFKGKWFDDLQKLRDKFIYYKFFLNDNELFFRAIILFEYLRQFDNPVDELSEKETNDIFDYNTYANHRFFIPKNQHNFIDDFSNAKDDIYLDDFIKKYNGLFITSFTDETNNVGIQVFGKNIVPLYEEIKEDFKMANTGEWEWIKEMYWYLYRKHYAPY
ncbi:MAG: hypothetical protein IKI11_11365 [Neisseriaceae bacterium]|nr:hypothetical protein [Neisseriaceae bacterium]